MTNPEFQNWLNNVVDGAINEFEQDVETRAWLVVVDWAKGEVPMVHSGPNFALADKVIDRANQIAAACDVKCGPCVIIDGTDDDED